MSSSINALQGAAAQQGMPMGQSAPPMGNALQGSPQPQQQPQAPQQAVTQHMVDEWHSHLSDMQQELAKLIKLPDSQLTLAAVFDGAADLIHKHQLSGGTRGATAVQVASEIGGKDFPQGANPSPQDLRKYLMAHFNKFNQAQAAVTSKYGPPSQQQPQEG